MGIITLRTTWIIMPINHVGRLYALAFTRDGFTISYTTLAYFRDESILLTIYVFNVGFMHCSKKLKYTK